MKPRRYSPFIPKEIYHDTLNWILAQNSVPMDRDEEVEELNFEHE